MSDVILDHFSDVQPPLAILFTAITTTAAAAAAAAAAATTTTITTNIKTTTPTGKAYRDY